MAKTPAEIKVRIDAETLARQIKGSCYGTVQYYTVGIPKEVHITDASNHKLSVGQRVVIIPIDEDDSSTMDKTEVPL